MANYKGAGNYKTGKGSIIFKTADVTLNNDSTVNDDADLKLVLSPSTRYAGYLLLRVKSHATPNITFTFKAITGTVYALYTGEADPEPATTLAFGTDTTFGTDDTDQFFWIPFMLKTGAGGGTLQFQWAQNTSNANNTIVKEGSMLVVNQV